MDFQAVAACSPPEVETKSLPTVCYSAYGYAELNSEGWIVALSPLMAEWVGCSTEELKDSPFTELLVPDDIDAPGDLFDSSRLSASSYRCKLRRKCGPPTAVELVLVPLHQGAAQGFLALVLDISQWKRAEAALREEECRYRALLDAVTSYTYTVRLDQGIPIATEHAPGCFTVTGYAAADFAAHPYLWLDMVHRKDQELVRQFVARILAGERVPPLEHRIIHRSGAVRWIRHTIVPRFEDGEFIQYDGVIEDITERKLAEVALRAREATLLAAQRIQAHLLPHAPQTLAGCDVAGDSQPADFTGGDYFDYLALPDRSVGFVVGDVSGHGLGPALVMAMIHAHLRSLAEMHSDLSKIVRRANQFLVGEEEEGMFVTLFLGALDPSNQWFRYVSAGHQPAYVFDREGEIKCRLESTSLPIGIQADAEFPLGEPVQLERGDLVLLLTDGIPEATSPAGEMFGSERALRLVRENRHLPAEEIIRRLYEEVHRFSGEAKLMDDMTSIVIKILPRQIVTS